MRATVKKPAPNVDAALDDVCRVLFWRRDIDDDRIKNEEGYNKEHCTSMLTTVSQVHLDIVCDAVNSVFKRVGSTHRVTNVAGEYIPATTKGE